MARPGTRARRRRRYWPDEQISFISSSLSDRFARTTRKRRVHPRTSGMNEEQERCRPASRVLLPHASSTVAPLRMCPTNAAAGIHSPLYSPGTLAPDVMRHCGRFAAVSKTVVGLWSTEGSNPSPSADRTEIPAVERHPGTSLGRSEVMGRCSGVSWGNVPGRVRPAVACTDPRGPACRRFPFPFRLSRRRPGGCALDTCAGRCERRTHGAP
jgi:hypothetical protein